MDSTLPPTGSTAPGTAPGSGDALSRLLESAAGLPEVGAVREVVADVLGSALRAFTSSQSLVDALPDTAPDSAQEALAVVAGVDKLRSGLAALDARWQVMAEQRIRKADADQGIPQEDRGRAAANEVALARRISPTSSSLSLAASRRLIAHMPATYLQLAEGRIPERNAQAITRALHHADADTCCLIDQWIEEDPTRLEGLGIRRTGQLVRELCQQVDPGASRGRVERAARARNVTMEPVGDGMARLTATLRALDAAAVMASLSCAAEAQRAAGARDSHQALQADQLVAAVVGNRNDSNGTSADISTGSDDNLHGDDSDSTDAHSRQSTEVASAPSRRLRLDIGIVITDRALLGRADDAECAQIEGYGSVPAHIITDTLRGHPPGAVTSTGSAWMHSQHPDANAAAVFRRLYTHPSTGELVAMESTARSFPVGLGRMIRWRDGTCRTPWCNARIRHLDHIDRHAAGGATSFDNGQGLCARCNYTKEHGNWTVSIGSTAPPAPPAPPTPPTPPASPAPPPSSTEITWVSPHGAVGRSPTPHCCPPDISTQDIGSDP